MPQLDRLTLSSSRKKKPLVKLPDGTTYEGEWLDDVIDGYGIKTYKHGVYQGQFINNLRHG